VDVGYSGDANYAGSDEIIPVTMTNPFTMTVSTPVVIASAGATTGNTSTLTVTPANGFAGPIYFSCTIEYYPPGAQHLPTCAVPASISVSGTSPATTTMTISSTPSSSAQSRAPAGLRWMAAQAAPFFGAIVLLALGGRRRSRVRAAGSFLLLALIGLTSCGGGGSGSGGGKIIPGTTSGNYVFMVEGSYTQTFGASLPQVSMVNVKID
jgi:hypothetical protein